MKMMLVGNPNCGKTTLFNALTGKHQRVGNWSGVTVEKESGFLKESEDQIQILDLPGLYSLTVDQHASQDVQMTSRAVLDAEVDVFINVIDACHLERHLYLTSQLLELNKPVIIALNMLDLAQQRGITIDTAVLSEQLGCPVVELQAHRKQGIQSLRQAMSQLKFPPKVISLPAALEKEARCFNEILVSHACAQEETSRIRQYIVRRWLEGDTLIAEILNLPRVTPTSDTDILMADARYQAIHQWVMQVQRKRTDAREYLTAKIDRIVLHRMWAMPLFLIVMYSMFWCSIKVGGAFQTCFDLLGQAFFVQGTAAVLQTLHAPLWLIGLLTEGLGKGLNTTLTFVPVLAVMFFLLTLLEISGYMARASFIVDRLMRMLGLPGQSFVPMMVSFGCNVPGILATRTLNSDRDRWLTMLMIPFMSCSARLAIYTVFVTAFFPRGGQNVIFSLYLIGVVIAMVTGFIVRKTQGTGKISPLILELPAYHRPALQRLLRDTALRLRYFLVRAGGLIVPCCMVLSCLNMIHVDSHSSSLLEDIAQMITPIFKPMGIQSENWPATVGLLTGVLAKEVVIGSLNSLYTQMGHLSTSMVGDTTIWQSIQAALLSIPFNLKELVIDFLHPWSTHSLPDMNQSFYGVMVQAFASQTAAYAYLLFILLYIPCISTMAVIRQEASRRDMWFAIGWSLFVAYGISVMFYQLATCMQHPWMTTAWTSGFSMSFYLWYQLKRKRRRDVVATS